MPVDASIYSEFKPTPIVNPLAVLMQLRGQTAEIQLHQAQAEEQRQLVQENQMKIAQQQRDLSDQNTIQAAMKDPVNSVNFGKGDASFLQGKLQPSTYFKLNDALRKQIEDKATLADKTLERDQNHHKIVSDSIDALMALPTDAARVAAYPGVKADLQAKGVTDVVKNIPDSISGKLDELNEFAAYNNLGKGITESAMARKTKAAELAGKEAETTLRSSETRQHNAEAGIKEAELAAMSSAPGTAEDKVAGIIDPQKYPNEYAAYLSQYKSAVKLEDKTAVLKEAQGEMSKIREATNPEIRAGKVADAVAIAKGTNPIIQGRELTVAGANRQAAEHVTAEGEYEKSLVDLNNSVSEAGRLHNLISAAQGGNMAAPGVIPIAELRGFVNRVNQTELRNVSSNAGSLADRIEGWVKGATEGQPIPPEILRATDELASLQVNQAEEKHAGSVKSINTARHENFTPLKASDLGYRPTTAIVPTPKTQAEYNALPKGASFKKPNDSKVYIKQ